MMNLRKKLVLGLTIGIMAMVFVGCSNSSSKNNEEAEIMNNFKFTVESSQEFDYIKYSVGDFEAKMEPMHDDKKVKAGYASNVNFDQEEMEMDVEVVQDEKVIFEKEDIKIDLTGGKKARVNLVDKDNSVDVEVNY